MQEREIPGLSKLRVKKAKLISKLEENRVTHQEEYEAAYAAWKSECIVALEKKLAQAKGEVRAKGQEFNLAFNLPCPQSYTSQYDEVIDMLNFSEGEEVVLSRREFNQYVRDKWEWTENFKLSASNYLDR